MICFYKHSKSACIVNTCPLHRYYSGLNMNLICINIYDLMNNLHNLRRFFKNMQLTIVLHRLWIKITFHKKKFGRINLLNEWLVCLDVLNAPDMKMLGNNMSRGEKIKQDQWNYHFELFSGAIGWEKRRYIGAKSQSYFVVCYLHALPN